MDKLIRRVLTITGWSQAEMARRIGVHKRTVQDWVQERQQPRRGVYADLHRALVEMQAEIDAAAEDIKGQM